jgi:hypothetical protein
MRRRLATIGLSLGLCWSAPVLAKPSQNTTSVVKQNKRPRTSKVKAPCYAPPVTVARARGNLLENRNLSLTFCDGTPNPAALDELSVLARPRDVERPDPAEVRDYQRLPVDRGPKRKRRDAAYLTRQILRVHPGLLVRLQRVAKRYPGKTIEIISGHRPDARSTSRHHHGFALDMRVAGVSREALRDFLRTFPETGVGYYPNSFFVHMDVREDKGYWVDRSGPGEKPDYGPWPPRGAKGAGERARAVEARGSAREQNDEAGVAALQPTAEPASERERRDLLNQVMAELAQLQVASLVQRPRMGGGGAAPPAGRPSMDEMRSSRPAAGEREPGRALVTLPTRRAPEQASEPEEAGEEDLDAEQIERIRRQARAALEQL